MSFLEDLVSKVEMVQGWYSSTIEQLHQAEISLNEKESQLFRSAARWHANSHFG